MIGSYFAIDRGPAVIKVRVKVERLFQPKPLISFPSGRKVRVIVEKTHARDPERKSVGLI